MNDLSAIAYNSPLDVLGLQAPIDFLRLLARTRDPAYGELYLGVCAHELARLKAGAGIDWPARTAPLLAACRGDQGLAPADDAFLTGFLAERHAALPGASTGLKRQRILFIGDCLFEEAELFLAAHRLERGLLFDFRHVVSKNPIDARHRIVALGGEAFDAVVFSPFTYSFNADFERLLHPRQAFASRARIDEMVEAAIAAVERTLDVIAETFDVPIFVSNTSTIQRGTTAARRIFKTRLTSRTRGYARRRLNAWLAAHLEASARDTHRHLFLLDEAAIAPTDAIQERLGAYLHTAEGLHPTRFSEALARALDERLESADLRTRKLVVCDLDNTLWQGVIGEGLGVTHHRDRQQALADLKAKGVILAIASKNDPLKVTWNGGVLDDAAFVAAEISWEPKVLGIQRILQDINIKAKDVIFLDDRADERAMVAERWPEMLAYDPCEPATWRAFAGWAEMLDEDQEFDRTASYQQRRARDAATGGASREQDAADMFAGLGLRATLKLADRSSLKRVAELINRTNQWNLAGSRVTPNQLADWLASDEHQILTVQVADKFGAMGTVCVAVVRITPQALEIPVFVLSCRVFGYGVETLVLDYVARLSKARLGVMRVHGAFTPTDHNGPCREMYPEHGFSRDGAGWKLDDERAPPPPPWFSTSGFEI